MTSRVRQREAEQERTRVAERRLDAARDVVAELQRTLLPAGLPVLADVDLAARYLVAARDQTAGGDWFDALLRAAVVVVALAVLGFLLRWRPVDGGVARWLNGARTGVVGSLSTAVYHLFSPAPAILLTVVATALVWWWSHRLRVAAAFAGTVAATWIPSDLLKLLVARPRPDVLRLAHPFLPSPADPSFPSGHAVFVTALVLAAVLVVRGTALHRVVAIAGSALVAVAALALSVDAVHYPTDVLGSVVWAVGVAPAARWLWVDVVLGRVTRRRDATV